MIRAILTILLLSISFVLQAQNFTGKAVYKTHRKLDVDLSKNENVTDEMQKLISEQLKKQFQKTYNLVFTRTESTYKQEQKLSAPQRTNVQIMIVGNSGGNDVLYKNIKEKKYANKTEISGKRFLIEDKLPSFDWKMTGETKTIGTYTCYKAERTREEKQFDVSSGKVKEETATVKTTAWYTPEIPISNGPNLYGGLPGLILEVHDGKETIVCSEIVLNPSKKITIKKPTKGKKVTSEEFNKIQEKKRNEMLERYKNNRKSKDGKSISIEVHN